MIRSWDTLLTIARDEVAALYGAGDQTLDRVLARLGCPILEIDNVINGAIAHMRNLRAAPETVAADPEERKQQAVAGIWFDALFIGVCVGRLSLCTGDVDDAGNLTHDGLCPLHPADDTPTEGGTT